MQAVFIELPAFERHREKYVDDDRFHELQLMLLCNPEAGDATLVPVVYVRCGSVMHVGVKESAAVCG
jgi:hypothetical protein